MTFVLFFAVLFVLILVHEWGHFIVAKKTGMRVDEFGIGFPPKLFGVKRGETEYSFNLLPIGGFVKIFGENYEEEFSPVASQASDRRSERSDAGEGEENYEEESKGLPEDERARAFGARPKWAQALVLVAGVAMNVIFAWFLLSAALMIGVPAVADEAKPSADAALVITGVLPDSPAAAADIPIGAKVLSMRAGEDTLALPTPTTFQEFIVAHGDQSVDVVYEKSGVEHTATMQPQDGVVSDDAARPAIGVSLSYTTIKREPIHTALYEGALSTWDATIAIASGLTGLLVQTFSGTADFSQIAGPIGIAGLVGDAAEFGLTSLMLFTAMISLNLAVINLLPIPALDGGRLLFVAIEAITRREIPPVWAARVNFVGFAFLMLLMLAVTYGDVVKML